MVTGVLLANPHVRLRPINIASSPSNALSCSSVTEVAVLCFRVALSVRSAVLTGRVAASLSLREYIAVI